MMAYSQVVSVCSVNTVDDIEDFGRDSGSDSAIGSHSRKRNSVKIHLRTHSRTNGEKSNGVQNGYVSALSKQSDENLTEEQELNCSERISECDNDNPQRLQNDLVPQNYKIFVKTWGCSHNSSDSEYMAGLLHAYGFQITESKGDADVWILNSCTVKGPAEQHFKNEIESGQKLGKHLIVSGCVPQSAPNNPYTKGLSLIGVQQIDNVVQVVEETLNGNTVRLLSQRKERQQDADGVMGRKKKIGGARLNLPKIRRNALIEIIPISTGCLNSCTYCKTKFARGDLGSYPIEEIVSRAEFVFQHEGVKEIWLTSEDTGAWGIDLGLDIVDLLKELVKVIPEGGMLRIGMTNPPYILDHLEEMSKILLHPRVYSFLHIPVQAGSDAVLGDMKREYCINDFEKIVDFLRERVPGVTIATDIICGFPTETAEDFKCTLQLVEKYKFPSLFINQFYPRPGTVAAKMPRISTQEVKRRTKELTNMFQSYTPYESSRIGQEYIILITEVSHDGRFLVGHNKFYEQILVAPPEESSEIENSKLMGKVINVKIVSTSKHSMIGVPLSPSSFWEQSTSKQILLFILAFLLFTMTFFYTGNT